MSDAREITLSISVDDNGTPVIKAFRSTTEKEFRKVESQAQSTTDRMAAQFEKFQNAWLRIGAAIAATAWLQDAARDALEAETAYNKLRIQVENMGQSFSGEMQQTINAASQYAMVQDEEVAGALQQMIFYSGQAEESTKSITLAYDLAYQKGISVTEAAQMIGQAMTGNIEPMGRYMSEFKNLDDTLGKNATSAQKAAYAQAVLQEKVAGAMGQMTQHERMVRDISLQYEQLKQSVGAVVLHIGTYLSAVFNGAAAAGLQLASGVFKALGAIGALTDKIGLTSGAFEKWQIEATAAHEAALALGDRAVELYNNSMGVETAMKAQSAATREATGTAADMGAQIKATNAAIAQQKIEMQRLMEEGFARLMQWSKEWTEEQNRRVDAASKQTNELVPFYEGLYSEMEQMRRSKQDDWLNLAEDYAQKETFLRAHGIEDMTALNKWYYDRAADLQEKETAKVKAEAQKRYQAEKQVEQQIYQMKLQVWQLAAGLLRTIGEENQAAAIAAIAIEKGLAMASVIVNAEAAKMRAIAELGPAGGEAYVIKIEAMKYASLALIAAQGISEAASYSGGSSSSDSSSSYSSSDTESYSYEDEEEEETLTQRVTVQVYALDPSSVRWDDLAEKQIIPAINRAGGRNVQLNKNVVKRG